MIRKNRATRGSANTSKRTRRAGSPAASPAAKRKESRGRSASGRSALGNYYSEIGRYPRMGREAEQAAARAAQAGDSQALDRLVESNLRFVVKLAHEYAHCGMPVEDLVSEGNIGLIEAAQRFDPERGTRFISFAAWWIRKSIHAALSEQAQVVRLPMSQIKKMRVVQSVERDLREELGREPTQDELAERLPSNLAAVDPIHRHGVRLTSIDEPVNPATNATFARTLEDEQPTIENRMLEDEKRDNLGSFCSRLNERQQQVISGRFGLDGEQRRTLSEIGEEIGLSREGVRQIESGAIKRLRKLIELGDRPRRPRNVA